MYRREVRRIVYPTKVSVAPVDVAKAHAATPFAPSHARRVLCRDIDGGVAHDHQVRLDRRQGLSPRRVRLRRFRDDIQGALPGLP